MHTLLSAPPPSVIHPWGPHHHPAVSSLTQAPPLSQCPNSGPGGPFPELQPDPVTPSPAQLILTTAPLLATHCTMPTLQSPSPEALPTHPPVYTSFPSQTDPRGP